MVAIPVQKLNEVDQLCRHHRVRRLELFGSAVSEQFDPASSDLDFLVQFLPLSPIAKADSYFGLLADLQDLFEREIDLVELEAIDNPFFLKSIQPSRQVLYAA